MTYHSAIASLNARFMPQSDTRERWQILKSKGVLHGDCEDYALTVALKMLLGKV